MPTIAGDLHGLSHLSWVGSRHYAGLDGDPTALWGQLGDMYGPEMRFCQAAIVIFPYRLGAVRLQRTR